MLSSNKQEINRERPVRSRKSSEPERSTKTSYIQTEKKQQVYNCIRRADNPTSRLSSKPNCEKPQREMEQLRKGRRLILFPLPFQGHINPMLELANILHLKGFSVTIIQTNYNSLNPSNHPHFTFHSIHIGLSKSGTSTKDPLLLLSRLNAKSREPFQECLAMLLSDVSKEPVACLITDSVYDFTQSVAESLKLPMIMLRTGSASSFAIYAAFPLLREKGYLPKQGELLESSGISLFL